MTRDEFIALHALEASHGNKQWRSIDVSEELCRELLAEGFLPETLLLAKRLPIGILEDFAKNSEPRIRRMVADKRAAEPLLDALSRDEDTGVRIRVCYNAKVSAQTLERLANDDSPDVRRAARRSTP